MAVGLVSTQTAKDGRMGDAIAELKKIVPIFTRLGAQSARVLMTDSASTTLILVIEAESQEAIGRIADRFGTDKEATAVTQAAMAANWPLGPYTLTRFTEV